MARILSVVWYKILPAKFGGQKGIAEFNQSLSNHHDLACICSKNNVPSGIEKYKVIPVLPVSKIQFANLFAWRKIIRAARQFSSGFVIIEHPYYGLTGIFLKKFFAVKLIIHSHNIECQRFREMKKWWWPILRWLEKTTHKYADLNLFKSKEDYLFAHEHFSIKKDKCLIVPFGVSRNATPLPFEKQAAKRKIAEKYNLGVDEKIILFNGTLDYAPNANAVKLIVQTIIPTLLEKTTEPFRIIICGRIIYAEFLHIKTLEHDRFLNAGFVDDIAEYFLAADVFINPVLEGGGIKVKVMEALSYNLNVISTISGAMGIDTAYCGKKLMVVEDNNWEVFCDKIVSAWNEHSETPSQFFAKYHWYNLIKPVAEKINDLQ